MRRVHQRGLTDDELRADLQACDTVYFVGGSVKWQEVERQVERLGFGDLYIVSALQRPNEGTTICLKPAQRINSVQPQAAA